jgi:hypothetical protein
MNWSRVVVAKQEGLLLLEIAIVLLTSNELLLGCCEVCTRNEG